MPYNPRTYNLFQNIDISNALEKARVHLDSKKINSSSICIKSDNPFFLAIRFMRYIRAFKIQMKNELDIDEEKYNLLKIAHLKDFVRISLAIEIKHLELINEQTGEKI